MNCPGCGTETGEEKGFCSNPACQAAAALRPSRAASAIESGKASVTGLNTGFVTLARVAAVVIAILAAAYLYFFARP